MSWQTMSVGSDTLPPAAANWSEAKEARKQVRRFLVSGGLSVLTDLAVYYALVHAAAWSVSSAKALSYLAGVIVGFTLNKYWTFESRRRSLAEPVTYLGLYLVTLAVNVFCNQMVLSTFGDNWWLPAFLFTTGVTTVLNFVGMRLVTFRRGIDERRIATIRLDASQTVNASTRKAG